MTEHRVVFDQARVQDFELIMDVGDPLSEDGLTRVTLDGTGHLAVEQQYGPERKEAPVHTKLVVEDARGLLKRVSQFDWELRFPSRSGLPDEAIVQWSFRDKRKGTVTQKAWLRDTEKDPLMAPVLAALRKAVERATNGKLYL